MIYTPKEVLQYPKMRANARIQCAWAIRTEQPACSLLLRLSQTGQTAVASIPRPGGCRDYMVCPSVPCLRCLLSLVGYLLGDLPVSSLVSSDPAWPARLLTRTFKVLKHVRGQMHPRCLCTYSLRAIAKRKSRTLQWMRANGRVWQHFFVRFTTLMQHNV